MKESFLLKTTELELDFIFKNTNYKIKGISKNKNNKLYINFGNYGDEFPCIMLEYDKIDNIFSIEKLRAQPFGGYSQDQRVLCIRPPLPEKGALDILVLLSLAIIDDLMSKNIVKRSAKIEIFDLAFNDRYPISWFKYLNGKIETAYSKYGFVIRNLKLYKEGPSYFDKYMREIIPEILNKKMSIFENSGSFKTTLNDFNYLLRSKNLRQIVYDPEEKVKSFITKVLDTKRTKEYEDLITIMDKKLKFDIRGTWYWSKDYYMNNVKDKVQNLNIDYIM
jgi:hypothetical protein